ATCSSSLRYKTKLAPYRSGLVIITRLQPIIFSWKADDSRDIGLGAEEVAKVEPLLTFNNAQGEVEGVKYNQLSVVLINAIKEQQAQIKEQQTQLLAQQRELENLKRLICQKHPKSVICKSTIPPR